MKRPLPILVTMILLGLLALLPLAAAGLMTVVLAGDLNGQPGYRLAAYAALIAVWPFLTAVGIAGYRRWGLISILGLAAAMAVLAGICLRIDMASPAGVPHQGFLPIELFYVALLGIGGWWLVYFSRPSTRARFGSARG